MSVRNDSFLCLGSRKERTLAMWRAQADQIADAIRHLAVARKRTTALLLAVATMTSLGGVALFLPQSQLIAVFHDDAFYYFGVARNVATGHVSSFDGIHSTNGYHSLWLATLVPIFSTFPGDDLPLRAILAVQLVLIAIAGIALYRMLVPRLGAAAVTTALALVTLPGASMTLAGGLESSLVLVLLVATW